MTYEEKKRFLRRYVDGKKQITSLLEDLEYWENIGTSTFAGENGGGSSRSGSKIETAAIKIVEIQAEIQSDINSITETREEVRNAVERLKTGKYKTVLYDVYIAGKTVDQVAGDRGCSPKKIYNMLHYAINMMDI